MSLRNPYGDLEITDPQALRALAHPVRLAILERLQRHGPATATQLSGHVGATPSVASWHLRHLAGFGLVTDAPAEDTGPLGQDRRQRWWRATATGFRFELGDDEESVAAARQLSRQLFLRYHDLPLRWLDADEPRLDDDWRRVGGLANTRFLATADEVLEIEERIEEILAPYVARKMLPTGPDQRGVRMMRYLLPEADSPADGPAGSADAGLSDARQAEVDR